MTDRMRRVLLAVGDVGALVVFTVIGLINHEGGVTLVALLEVVGPIVMVGAVASIVFGTYRRPSIRTLLPAWALAVPLGILIRRELFHEPSTWGSSGVFMLVALAFSLLFLVAWRLLARFVLRSSRGPAPARST